MFIRFTFRFYFLLLIFFIPSFLEAQGIFERTSIVEELETQALPDDLYFINKVTYRIEGQTLVGALKNRIVNVEDKLHFTSLQELEERIAILEKQLNASSYFSHAFILYFTEENPRENSQARSVHLLIYLKDKWPILPLIIPRPSSGDGLSIPIRMGYKNFFGTLTDLNFSSDIVFDLSEDPTKANSIRHWKLNFSSGPFPLLGLSWYTTFEQSFHSSKAYKDDIKTLEYAFNKTFLSLSSFYPIWSSLGYSFSPGISTEYGHVFYLDTDHLADGILASKGLDRASEFAFSFNYNHTLSWSRVHTQDYLRQGYAISLGQNLGFYYPFDVIDERYQASISYFFRIKDFNIELSTRALVFYDPEANLTEIEYNRGTKPYRVYGNMGLFSNNTIAFNFWTIPEIWVAQIGLFFDIGVTKGVQQYWNQISYSDNFNIGYGIEGSVYLDFSSGFMLYGRLGIDQKQFPSLDDFYKPIGGPYNIDISLGKTY